MPSKTFTITSVNKIKDGETDEGREWTLFRVNGRDAEGKALTFSTFSKQWSNHISETVTAEFELQKRGAFTNLVLGAFPQPEDEPSPPARGKGNGNGDKFDTLNKKLDRILALLEAHFRT